MPAKSWMFPFKAAFNASFVMEGPWKNMEFDMFTWHSVWRAAEVRKFLPNATYLTLLRDPVDCFESNYVYMGLENAFNMTINEFAEKKAAKGMLRRPKVFTGKNQLLWDLGMHHLDMEDKELVQKRINETDSEFDLVMIVEHFDESLILMADLLCWPLEDLKYLKQNQRIRTSKSNITAETRSILKDWLWADFQLYDHHLDRFKKRLQDYGKKRMEAKVSILNLLNKHLLTECVKEKADNTKLKGEFRMALNIVYGYVIDETKPWCAAFARSEPNFAKQLREAQNKKLKATKKEIYKCSHMTN